MNGKQQLTEDQQAELNGYAQQAIAHIENLYPPDAENVGTAGVGIQDMINAIASEWRTLPVEVLQHMAAAQIERQS